MDKKTAKALEQCIEKYEQAADADDATLKMHGFTGCECALCAVHFCPSGQSRLCVKCPVRERTGRVGCVDTPWFGNPRAPQLKLSKRSSGAPRMDLSDVMRALGRGVHIGEDQKIILDHVRDRCKQEAEFLKSLRDTNGQQNV